MHKNAGDRLWALFLACVLMLFYGCAGTRVVVEHDPDQPRPYERKYENRRNMGGPPPWAPAHGYRAKRYMYYPSAQVYYDTERGVYFYYGNDRWQVSAKLPVNLKMKTDDHVTLEMETDRPYEHHSEVVRRYPPGLNKGR